jgi:transcriptional regulator with XRE-family HTH domain
MISQRYYTDAAFERVCELPPKTVSNWRRGRSASYMKMLPRLAETLGVDVRALLSDETEEDPPLTREETVLLDAFRQARALPASARGALLQTLLTMIRLSCGGAQ